MLDAILSTSKEAFDSVENGAVSARSQSVQRPMQMG
jgi:hypothetical protein